MGCFILQAMRASSCVDKDNTNTIDHAVPAVSSHDEVKGGWRGKRYGVERAAEECLFVGEYFGVCFGGSLALRSRCSVMAGRAKQETLAG
jgi:hypothetical protein